MSMSNTSTNTTIDGYISIGSAQPLKLYKKLTRLQPNLSLIHIEENNEPVSIPKHDLGRLPLNKLSIAADKNKITFFMGDFTPTFKALDTDHRMLFWLRTDHERYSRHLNKLASVSAGHDDTVHLTAANQEDALEKEHLISIIKQEHSTTLQALRVDRRGIVINYNIQYH